MTIRRIQGFKGVRGSSEMLIAHSSQLTGEKDFLSLSLPHNELVNFC